jgi:OOP family OmpA-OmpF porin
VHHPRALLLCATIAACVVPNRAPPRPAAFVPEPRGEQPGQDDDGDQVLAPVDRCPDDPEDCDEHDDADGCPDDDNDGDRIADRNDACPNVAEDLDGFEDANGCPDPDNDGDGILDVDDHSAGGHDCRNDPEVFNGCADDDGCPDSGPPREHATASIAPLPHADGAIDSAENLVFARQLAEFLQARPDIDRVAVEGHVAERRRPNAIRRSEDIAVDVGHMLVRLGVDRSRLITYGVGDLCPADPRQMPEADMRNDRVVFHLVFVNGRRTRAVVGCSRARRLIPATIGPPGPPRVPRC